MSSAEPRTKRGSSQTRERLVEAAVSLYGSRSIDAVSLREIGAAAGQKNSNALQYHFGSRDGLLQAIVDTHATGVEALRASYYAKAEEGIWSPHEAAARCLVMPIVDYVDKTPAGLDFVRIVAQIRALSPSGEGVAVEFPRLPALRAIFDRALDGLPQREARRRVYLVVNTAFHSVAEVCNASDGPSRSPLSNRGAMVEQLVCMLSAYLAAPAVSA